MLLKVGNKNLKKEYNFLIVKKYTIFFNKFNYRWQ